MKKSFKIVYTVLVLTLLCLPMGLLRWLDHRDENLEKKAPVQFPDYLTEGRLNVDFSDQFESWMNDNLPLRAELLTVSNRASGELLQGQTANMIVGRDGWLFFASEAPDYMNTNAMTDAQVRAVAVTLSLLQEKVEAGGGRFTFAAVPNKSTVYPEQMPCRFRHAEENNLTRIQALLPEYGVNYVDLRALLTAARDEGVYHRRDSHWNYRGALMGANAILDSLGRLHDDHGAAPCTVERIWRGDLDKLLLPAGGEMDDQIVYDVRHADFEFTNPRGVKDVQEQLRIFMSDLEQRDMTFSTKNRELHDGSSLYAARDSFGRALLPWMIDSYENAAFCRRDVPEVNALAPGTDVVFEIAERNLSRIIHKKAPFMFAPARTGITAEGLTVGETLEVVTGTETAGSVHLCGAFPEDARLGDGRVYLLLRQGGTELCVEAFPVFEAGILEGEEDRSGFSAYLPETCGLSGSVELTVVAGATAYPCGPVTFP